MSDNPAFENTETATTNVHRTRWSSLYASGVVASDNKAMREAFKDSGALGRVDNEAQVVLSTYLDANSDGNIDGYATTATAASHDFGPSGTGTPASIGALREALPLPVPSTTWTTGQYVLLGDETHAYWTRTTVPATTGTASTDVFSSTAHGLSVGQPVIFTALTGGAGASTNTVYVVKTVPNANSFTLETPAGTALNITTDVTAATTITGSWTAGNAP